MFCPWCIGRSGASKRRRLILLLSVGWLPPSLPPSGACLGLGTSVLYQPLHAVEGCPTPGPRRGRWTSKPACQRLLGFPWSRAPASGRPPGPWPPATPAGPAHCRRPRGGPCSRGCSASWSVGTGVPGPAHGSLASAGAPGLAGRGPAVPWVRCPRGCMLGKRSAAPGWDRRPHSASDGGPVLRRLGR